MHQSTESVKHHDAGFSPLCPQAGFTQPPFMFLRSQVTCAQVAPSKSITRQGIAASVNFSPLSKPSVHQHCIANHLPLRVKGWGRQTAFAEKHRATQRVQMGQACMPKAGNHNASITNGFQGGVKQNRIAKQDIQLCLLVKDLRHFGEGVGQILLVGVKPCTNLPCRARQAAIYGIIHSRILLAEDFEGVMCLVGSGLKDCRLDA